MAIPSAAKSDSALLTLDDIHAKAADLQRAKKAMAAAAAKIEELQGWFDGLRKVIGDAAWRSVVPVEVRVPSAAPSTSLAEDKAAFALSKPTEGIERAPLKKWVFSVLQDSDRGLAVEDFLAAAKRNPPPDDLFESPTDLRMFLDVCADRGRLRRRKNLYFTRELLERVTAAGGAQFRTAELQGALLDSLKKLGGRSESGDIIKMALENAEVAGAIKKNRAYGYTLLSRMVKDGRLQKDGKAYILVSYRQHPRESSVDAGPGFTTTREGPSQSAS